MEKSPIGRFPIGASRGGWFVSRCITKVGSMEVPSTWQCRAVDLTRSRSPVGFGERGIMERLWTSGQASPGLVHGLKR